MALMGSVVHVLIAVALAYVSILGYVAHQAFDPHGNPVWGCMVGLTLMFMHTLDIKPRH